MCLSTNAGVLMLPQREYLCRAVGEHLSTECRTNHSVLEWSIKFSSNEYHHNRFITRSSRVHYRSGWISSGIMTIKYSKNSEPGVIPIISTLHISNITNTLNGFEINCTGLDLTSLGERISVIVLYITSTNGKSKNKKGICTVL